MKPKEIFYALGFKPGIRTYDCDIKTFELERDGQVKFAQWLHPYEKEKAITQSEVDSLRGFLKEGDVALDIGAHSGDSTIPIALALGKSGSVLAFEPNPYVYEVLKTNARLNETKTTILPFCYAATPEDGSFEFKYSDEGYCNGGSFQGISQLLHGHAFRLQVQGRNLQNLMRREYPELIPKLRYIKIDTEGYDLVVLQSLSDLIAEQRPYLKVEVYKRLKPAQRQELFDYLIALQYKVYRVIDNNSHTSEPIQESDLRKHRHFDAFCVPTPA
jgi:FkbM family methyltransferase